MQPTTAKKSSGFCWPQQRDSFSPPATDVCYYVFSKNHVDFGKREFADP